MPPTATLNDELEIITRAIHVIGRRSMPSYSPELIQTMRAALDEVMTKIPPEQATAAIKAYLAECILKAAAEGQTGPAKGDAVIVNDESKRTTAEPKPKLEAPPVIGKPRSACSF